MATNRPTPSFKKLTRGQSFAAMKLLEQHTVLVATEPRTIMYAEGWDDARVAREAFPDYPGHGAKAVAKLRNEEFGLLWKPPPPAPVQPDLFSPGELERTKARVTALERALGKLAGMLGVELSTLSADIGRAVPAHGSGP
jgi:hypothetical protein